MNDIVRHRWWLRLLVLSWLLAHGLAHADITKTQSFEYRLGPGDMIKVDVFGRSDLSRKYTIRNSGDLSLLIAGVIRASDLTLNQLETEIQNRYSVLMKSESGPDQAINVSIEIVKYRPFYIMGNVSKPGSYSYQPRLTVVSAIAIAGGYASSDPDARVSEIRARESMNVQKSKYIAAITREARLIAEHEERDKIAFPPGLLKIKDDPFVAEMLEIETQLFTIRRAILEQELEIIHKRKLQFGVEDKTLAGLSSSVASKRKEVDAMLEGARRLSEEGLIPKFDLSNFVIMRADVERESRQLVVSQSRAKRGISEMEQQALILRGQRKKEIASELQKVRLAIDEILVHLRAEADHLSVLKVKTVSGSSSAEEGDMPKVRITREKGGSTVSFEAAENSVVLPGDIVSVPYQEGEVFLSLPDRGKNQ